MGDTRAIDSLTRGIETAKSGNKLLARLHLLQAVELAPRDPNCWLWLAWVAESPASAIHSLQRVLDDEPGHELAQLGMRWAKAMADFEYQEYTAEAGKSDIAVPDPSPAEHTAGTAYEDFSSADAATDRGYSGEHRDAEDQPLPEDNESAAFGGECESSIAKITKEEEAGTDSEREPFTGSEEADTASERLAGEEVSQTVSEHSGQETPAWFLSTKQEAESAEAEDADEREASLGWFDEEPSTPAENEEAELGESDEARLDAEDENFLCERSRNGWGTIVLG